METVTMSSVEAVTEEPRKAITEWCDDLQWEALDGHLKPGVWRRLMRAKRALYAATSINRALFEDHLGKCDKKYNDAEFEGLHPGLVEALRIAVLELGDHAEGLLTEVQDDDHGCVTGRLR